MPAKPLLIATAGLILALPASAQQGAGTSAQPQPAQPVTNTATPAPSPSPSPSPSPQSVTRQPVGSIDSQTGIADISEIELPEPPPPIELPDHARRDPWTVGALDPSEVGLGSNPWGAASGAFLSGLMRRMDTPLASRWGHIAVRNALLARDVHRSEREVHGASL